MKILSELSKDSKLWLLSYVFLQDTTLDFEKLPYIFTNWRQACASVTHNDIPFKASVHL